MSDNGATAFPTQLVLTCGFCCGTIDVNWFCKSCAASMCNTCKTSHPKIPAFKNHVIVPRTNDVVRLFGPSKIAEQCPLHPEKELSTYCKDCEVPCCVTCQVQNHNRHDISSIEDAYLSAEKRLNDNVRKLEKEVMPTLDKMANKTKNVQAEKRDIISMVREEVNAFRKEMKQVVDESCHTLLEKLNQNDIEFDKVITRINSQKRKCMELIKEIEGIIHKGDLSMIKFSPPSHRTLIPEIRTPNLAIPVFTPGRDILTTIKDRIGAIEWTDRTPDPNLLSSPITTFDPSMINIHKVITFRSDIPVTSITTVGNNTAWVMNWNSDTMYLYDSSGKVVGSITVKGCKGINGMVITRSGEMIVACWDRKVRRVSVSGEVSTLKDTSPHRPHCVCLTDSEDLVVYMKDMKRNNYVAVYSPYTGKTLREIRGSDRQVKQQITEPYRVVSNGKDLCVVNIDPNHVVCVDERGDVKWVYDGKEAKLSRSFDPYGISVDKYNNLLVTDYYNSCIHYIDRVGMLIKIILRQEQTGLMCPRGICVDDKTGQVWVGNEFRDVVICKYIS